MTRLDLLPIRRVLAPNAGIYTLEGHEHLDRRERSDVRDRSGTRHPRASGGRCGGGRIGRRGARYARSSGPRAGRDPVRTARRTRPCTRSDSPARPALSAGQRVRAGGLDLATVSHARPHVRPRGLLRARSGALFTGDTVLGRGTSFIDPPDGDLVQYLRSLRRLLDLDPRSIYPGHGPAVLHARDKLVEYLAHRDEREAQVVSALAEGPRTIAEMVEVIYADHPDGGASTRRSLGAGAARASSPTRGEPNGRQGRRWTWTRLDAENVPAMRTPGQGEGRGIAIHAPLRCCSPRVGAARSRRTRRSGPGIGRALARRDRRRRAPRALGSRSPAWHPVRPGEMLLREGEIESTPAGHGSAESLGEIVQPRERGDRRCDPTRPSRRARMPAARAVARDRRGARSVPRRRARSGRALAPMRPRSSSRGHRRGHPARGRRGPSGGPRRRSSPSATHRCGRPRHPGRARPDGRSPVRRAHRG